MTDKQLAFLLEQLQLQITAARFSIAITIETQNLMVPGDLLDPIDAVAFNLEQNIKKLHGGYFGE